MQKQLDRIEADVREVKGHVLDLKETGGEQRAKTEGHAKQLTIIWTIILGAAAAMLAAGLNGGK